MKKNLYIILLHLSLFCKGQDRNSIWVFGDSAGVDFSNTSSPVPVFSGMDQRGSCASIADTSGNLLFYCFSCISANDSSTLVFTSINDTMMNGSYLIGSGQYNQVIIIPMPNDSTKYYVFHLGYYSVNGLYYSIIDMNLNGGLGEVIQKNIQLTSFPQGDCIEAVKHANGRDWWLISKLGGNGSTQINRFFAYKISPGVIDSAIIQDFGNASDGAMQKVIVGNNGNKLMNINIGGLMTEYDFDRCTGFISNPNIIFQEQSSNNNRYFLDGAYSLSDSLFYVSSIWLNHPADTSRFFQFHLFSTNIPASVDTLFQIRFPVTAGLVRLAPDSKIYFSFYYQWGFPGFPYPDSVRNVYNENLSVVNNPDVAGNGCNFTPFSFYLGGKRTYFSLPNNPNYELGRLVGSPCDTLYGEVKEIKSEAELFVFYHPAWQKLFVNAQKVKGKNCLLQLIDVSGREVFSSAKKTQPPYFTQDVDVSFLSAGLYVVRLQTEREVMSKKFIKD